jgi:hypothetical protein
MNRVISSSLFTFLFFLGSFQVQSQALKKGDLVIAGFSSYPNWGKFLIESSLASSGISSYNVKGIPPSGLRFEFMLSNEIGFTLDGIYNSWDATWSNNSGFENNINLNRTRVQIGFNYHVPDIDSEELDLYGGFALGTNTRNISFSSDDPTFDAAFFIDNPFVDFPLSSRFRLGASYYVSSNVGINFELATGGPVIALGVLVKL